MTMSIPQSTSFNDDTRIELPQDEANNKNQEWANNGKRLVLSCLFTCVLAGTGGFAMAAGQDLIEDGKFFWQQSEPVWVTNR